MYMHGETRDPRWDEKTTSLIVATVALGVGLGSPLAGYLSGGKVELGLVPLGCVGMMIALVIAAVALEVTWVLVIALVIIGFFSGFYMVPLYTLLQQRAPKKSKGELVATSNFINVTGAILASGLFFCLVWLSQVTGITPQVDVEDRLTVGEIEKPVELTKKGSIRRIDIELDNGKEVIYRSRTAKPDPLREPAKDNGEQPIFRVIEFDEHFFDLLGGTPQVGDRVIVSRYKIRDHREHFLIRLEDREPRKVYDTEFLPSYLFLGAAVMTLGILVLLWRSCPISSSAPSSGSRRIGKIRLKAVGMQNLPTEGPVILATNCKDMIGCLEMVSATDRTTRVVLIEDEKSLQNGALLRALATRFNLIIVPPRGRVNRRGLKRRARHSRRCATAICWRSAWNTRNMRTPSPAW